VSDIDVFPSEAVRHTFASQWVLSGQDLYRLKDIMGHSSIQVTERYARLGNHTPDNVLAAADITLG
jgi:site-specific recombinase XerD